MKIKYTSALQKFRPALSVFLSFALLVQIIGPGVLAVKVAYATNNNNEEEHEDGGYQSPPFCVGGLFSDQFNGSNLNNWTTHDSKWSLDSYNNYAKASDDTGTNDDNLAKSVSTSYYSNLTLSFKYKTSSLDNGDKVYVQWFDGSTWQDLVNPLSNQSNWTTTNFNIPAGGNDNSNFAFRFTAHLKDGGQSDHGDTFYLDDVCIKGIQGGKLTINKTVDNSDGGTAQVADFNLKIDGNIVTNGVANLVSAGLHNVSEVNLPNYSAGDWGGDCSANGEVNVPAGQSKVCSITNTYIPEKPEEPPVIENSCVDPTVDVGTKIAEFGVSPELPLQTILNNAGYTLNAVSDETGYESWNVPSGLASVSLSIKLIEKIAGNTETFGYYTDGDVSNFTPVFSIPPTVNGTVSAPITIDTTSVSSIGFALKSDSGSSVKTFATEPTATGVDDSGNDHAVVYNPSSNKYVVAFEDLPFSSSDKDYNDTVIEVSVTGCTRIATECVPGVELLSNGSFEKPIVSDPAGWDIYPSGTPDLGWVVEWFGGAPNYDSQTRPELANLEFHRGILSWLPKDGDQYAELDTDWGGPSDSGSGEPASVKIYQDIATVSGKKYDVKFSFSPRPNTPSSDNMLDVLWGGNPVDSLLADGSSNINTVWTDHSYTLTATGPTTRLEFIDKGTPNSLGTFLDNVSVQCSQGCVPSSGTVSSDTNTSVTDIDGGSMNASSTLVTATSITNQYWMATTGDANAKWIWSEDPETGWTVDKVVTFSKSFDIPGTPSSITGSLVLAADNTYTVKVNNTIVEANGADGTFGSGAVTYNISGALQAGLNTLTVVVTNKGQQGDQVNNPGGLLYTLTWNANCGGDNGGGENPTTSKVHIQKFVDGKLASFEGEGAPIFTTHVASSQFNGDVALMSSSYEGLSGEINNNQGNVTVYEVAGGNGNPVVSFEECRPGKFYLDGYTIATGAYDTDYNNLTKNQVVLNSISADQYVTVWNKSCPTDATVIATKIVCTDETDLPNWGNGGPNITSATATDWVNSHKSCSFEPNWQFEWAPTGTPDAGMNLIGSAGGAWTTSGLTAADGTVTIHVPVPEGNDPFVWFREVLKNGYIPFTFETPGHTQNDNPVSAEVYCNTDVLNYDNYDRIDGLQIGGTYYCVAWNVPKATDVGIEKTVDESNPQDATATYTLVVTNHGPGVAQDVEVTDALPEGLTYSNSSATQGSYDPNTHIWTVGFLDVGSSATLTMDVTIDGQDEIVNEADVSIDPQIDINSENNHGEVAINVEENPSITTACTENCGGGGGSRSGDFRGATSFTSSGGTSGGGNQPEVLGASIGLPDTGFGPVLPAAIGATNSSNLESRGSLVEAFAILLAGILALIGLNIFSVRVLKLHK